MALRKLSFVTILCFASSPARADDWLGARSAGRGGTGLADVGDVGAVSVNVSALALAPRYDLVAGGVRGPDDTWLGRVAAVDSRTSAVTLGANYSYKIDNVPPVGAALPGWVLAGDEVDNPTTHQALSVGLAYPFLGNRLGLGVTGRYDWRVAQNEGEDDGFNFGVGLAGRPSEAVTLAAGVQNVVDHRYADTRRLLDLGVRWQPGQYLALEVGVKTEWMGDPFEESLAELAGIDLFATEWLALRGGWQHENGLHTVGGGIGLVSARADLDYALTGEVGSDPARLWHGLDLRVHF
ncbi:MAG: hypothetical protein FJ090_05885 [Deltaproteobacteria bacterium]|nr:hypothetical protein [Deltaproteobacteria bacterium]